MAEQVDFDGEALPSPILAVEMFVLQRAEQPLSHHLKILVDVGILTRNKRGEWAYALIPALSTLWPLLSVQAALRATAQLARHGRREAACH